MPWPWRQWPGPPSPLAIDGLPGEGYLDLVARPHIPTVRARAALPLILSLLMPLPILLGGLPNVLLAPVPLVWTFLPWMMRREWLATQAYFAPDHLVLRRATGKVPQQVIALNDLSRIDATQNPLQARTGSCTLRFLHVPDDGDAKELAVVRDIEWSLAQQILANYQAAFVPPDDGGAMETQPSSESEPHDGAEASNWSASRPSFRP